MVSNKNMHGGGKRPDMMDISLEHLGEMVSPFIYDAKRNDITNPEWIAEALSEVRRLLVEGFKKESYKGQLYYALHSSLTHMIDVVSREIGNDEADMVSLSSRELSGFKVSYIQLSEAAIQFGGSPHILPGLRHAFSNFGRGHGPAEEKYKANLLREMENKTVPPFLAQYPVGELSDDALLFYAPPTPGQRVM